MNKENYREDTTEKFEDIFRESIEDLKDIEFFIGYGITPFHVLSILAFSEFSSVENGTIFISPHPKSGIVVGEKFINLVSSVYPTVRFVKLTSVPQRISLFEFMIFAIQSLISKCRRKDKRIYVISPLSPNIKIGIILKKAGVSCLKYICVDDGVGSYFSKEVWRFVQMYDKKESFRKNRIKVTSISKKVFKEIIRSMFNYILDFEKWFLFDKLNRTEVNVNNHVSKSLQKVIRNVSKYWTISTPKRQWALIVTQPFVEYNQIEEELFLKLLRHIIKTLQYYNIDPVLKPHPREIIEKYSNLECSVINDKSMPSEFLFKYSPLLTIGFTSTTLLTSAVLFSIPSLTISKLLIDASKDPLLQISTKEFLELFKNFLYVPETLSDFRKLVYSISK